MIKFLTLTLAGSALVLAACSNGTAEPAPSENPDASTDVSSVASLEISEKFYCDAQLNGQHYFYLDPENTNKGIVGFEFSKAYQTAYPDEVAPSSHMQSAVSGSGMRYVNDQMEFRAKGVNGFLTLSDGSTLECSLQPVKDQNEASETVGGSLAFEWSANGFETLPADFKWQGYGGDSPILMLSVPETDNFVWISQCDGTNVTSYVQLIAAGLRNGDQTTFQVETDKTATRVYPIEVGPLPFGDGGADGAISPILVQSLDDPMFTDLTQGEWGYFQLGEGDKASKLRINLFGSISAWNSFIPACRNLNQ
ncbi:hypothetical protein DES40_1136 [Litorimonas taeanensis]|uniref:Membrane-bound lysozyme inhibitor of c-type lysozyme MliC n=1 Tax=Litorimonas taeanensis TaxID=568099 RepID=A0A420WLM5_9PROT|nr:hypothetical protein [Litorimonas taeanensis]RKQ71806.1 hypothetical protein DES40_1136 [Litorimonas taeanensis]